MSLIDAAGYADLPHLIRSHKYANRVMPWQEFQTREVIAGLRSGLAHAGSMSRLNATGISMNLTNRIRAEFGLDDDGMIPSDKLDAVMELLVELHEWAHRHCEWKNVAELRDDMRRVVGGGHAFPSKGTKRGPRIRSSRVKCWWEEYEHGNA
ncbi:hypothetical protein C7E18_04800 [Stenotrophomonas maltophilia]|nr:hypothetical protein C7E18_04800 [Stenotrophomonas maltophilia]